MTLTRKIACPACKVGLKIATSLPAGKPIECPKCGDSFRVPGDAARSRPGNGVQARPRKAAPPIDDDDEIEEEEIRPRKKKNLRRKKPAASNVPLIAGIVAGVLLLVGGACAVAFVWKPWEKKSDTVADNSQKKPPFETTSQAASGPDSRGDQRQGELPTGSGEPARARGGRGPSPGGEQSAGAGDAQGFAAARSTFEQSCMRCHSLSGGGRGRGPNLGAIGRNPSHTADWLAKYIRNPKAVKPDSRMPRFDDKLNDADIKALADFLASLK